MNWTHRRPFRRQLAFGGVMAKGPATGFREHHRVPSPKKPMFDQPIDAIRLQLADYRSIHPCPVHRPQQQAMSHRREHPYITTFSDHRSSIRRTHSSVHSISTIATDFVHQRVSTIHTYPSSASALGRQAVINEDNDHEEVMVDEDVMEHHRHLATLLDDGGEQVQVPVTEAPPATVPQEEQPTNRDHLPLSAPKETDRIESQKCRSCAMLIDIVDQQTQQIRQYAEQISQQADLLARLARRVADVEEGIDDENERSESNISNNEPNNPPVITIT